MTAKNSRASFTDYTGNPVLAPLNLLADLPRKQLALATQAASAMFRGAEAIRKIQQQAAHRASTHNEEVTQRLRSPCDANDLLAIQADLLRFNLQEAAQYWQQLTSAALKIQADMVSTTGEVLEAGAAEPTLDSLQRAFAASLNGGATGTAAH